MRICLVYDCLYPWTVGGAERWYRSLAEHLGSQGHSVTYLTLRQWPVAEPPVIPGVRVVAVGPGFSLYDGGRRRIWPPLRFGLGVFAYLARYGQRHDIVHSASFPYFAAIAGAVAQPLGRYRLVIDWWEVWTSSYWVDYLGPIKGRLGSVVQGLLARLPHRAVCFSRLHASRLRATGGPSGSIVRGVYPGLSPSFGPHPHHGESAAQHPRSVVVFVGRHIPEKRPEAIPPAVELARRSLPTLRAEILGDGPERSRLERLIRRLGLASVIETPGFVSEAELDDRLRDALCLVLPSRREGYGLAVLDALSRGTPAVVVRGPDSAATELIEPGVNGVIAASAEAQDLAAAILDVEAGGDGLRRSTAAWWSANRSQLSIESGLEEVLEIYRSILAEPGRSIRWGTSLLPRAGGRGTAPSGPVR